MLIEFKYRDSFSNGKWLKQTCSCDNIEECIKFYGLGRDCEYEILTIDGRSVKSTKKETKKPAKKSTKSTTVTTICYGKTETWKSRKEAIAFYTECFYCSEGSEHERYANILMDLQNGKTICRDGDDM